MKLKFTVTLDRKVSLQNFRALGKLRLLEVEKLNVSIRPFLQIRSHVM